MPKFLVKVEFHTYEEEIEADSEEEVRIRTLAWLPSQRYSSGDIALMEISEVKE